MKKKNIVKSQQNTPRKDNQLDITPYNMHYTANVDKCIKQIDLLDSIDYNEQNFIVTDRISQASSLTFPENNDELARESNLVENKTIEMQNSQSQQSNSTKSKNKKKSEIKVPEIGKIKLNKETFDLDQIEDLYKQKQVKHKQAPSKNIQNYVKKNVVIAKEGQVKAQHAVPLINISKIQNAIKLDNQLDRVEQQIIAKKNELNQQIQQDQEENCTFAPQLTINSKRKRRSFQQFLKEQTKFVVEKEEKLNQIRAQNQEIEIKAIREFSKSSKIKCSQKFEKKLVERLYQAPNNEKSQQEEQKQQIPIKKMGFKFFQIENQFSSSQNQQQDDQAKLKTQEQNEIKVKKGKSKHSDEYFIKKLKQTLKQYFSLNKILDHQVLSKFLKEQNFVKKLEEQSLIDETYQILQKENQIPFQSIFAFLATVLGIYSDIKKEKNECKYG